MPFLIPIAQTIGAAISAAIAAVAAAVIPIIAAVAAAVAVIASVVIAVSIVVVEAMLVALTWVGSWVVSQIGWLTDWMAMRVFEIYFKLGPLITSVYDTFTLILETIHFKTILEVHSIVYIVSPQYRDMMKKVYAAIGKASKALGLGFYFLPLAIQNVRNLVLTTSTLFGKRYDLAQVTWLATLKNYLDHFNTHAQRYVQNPEALFWDLAELIERPTLDGAGAFEQSIVSGLQTALKGVSTITSGFSQIGVDITKLHTDLPQWLQDRLPDPGLTWWQNMQGFLDEWYIPQMSALQGAVDAWQGRLTEAQATVSQLVDDLRRPGTMMAKVDTLGTIEREAQEDLMAEITTRRLNRLLTDLQPTFSFATSKMEANARIPIPPPSVLPILSYESATASVPSPGAMVPRSSWFVGDF